ncbi:Hpt domain-containing protein [Marinomonas mediterranea]|jgi:Hpt domain.|uniref:Hpt domain protein n=1 Tax=Marinomonas mediterranea (strain ATCC 700492 / JCM 21426 / NBRC 103028 / MMB-1) TaxID=717774 RepID=F2JVY6_MARM1|nr:Hpt domain-containing protein [Marinomonas mediterranea]ADZ92874.1 Hpt domain protein [Marinomonas mediterranea MMB-1]WCN10807.1 hypothetical protein GV055_18680 [Marinomonas mediterranea]WCN14864.1 hypothetical protein GV054_18560 [Marinomonas mediterranea]WCN18896.1 hypothetical protein GV053_18550 [Marinomonas mediterranea MMB-1]
MTSTAKQFDYHDFKWRLGENTELMKVVVSEFLNEAYSFLEAIEDEVTAKNWNQVAPLAHKVKGASSEVSSLYLPSLAKKLELAARDELVDEVLLYKADLKKHFDALAEEMRVEFDL